MTQETFLHAYRGRHGFRGDAKATTWLRSVAANTLKRFRRDQGRQKRRAKELSLDGLDEHLELRLVESGPGSLSEPGPQLRQALSEESVRLMRAALAELPDRMRACVRLSLDQGLRYREIAVTLKMSEGAVKRQLFEARAKLKERLAPHLGDNENRRP